MGGWYNAGSMEERCEVLAALPGGFCECKEECPHLQNLDGGSRDKPCHGYYRRELEDKWMRELWPEKIRLQKCYNDGWMRLVQYKMGWGEMYEMCLPERKVRH
jgi:hypothetical protein